MTGALFDPLRRELDLWRAEARTLEVWIRDDDAIAPAAAIDRLLALAGSVAAPVALAVIPEGATAALAERLEGEHAVSVLTHGWAHRSHAEPPAKKAEFGADRPLAERRADAAAGFARIGALFGDRAAPVFTPPWNRAAPDLWPHLAEIGFAAISTFGPRARAEPAPGLVAVNTHLDPIDWKGSRSLADPETLIAAAARALSDRRAGGADAEEPFGLLTHCLVHDEAIWSFCARLLEFFAEAGDVVRLVGVGEKIGRARLRVLNQEPARLALSGSEECERAMPQAECERGSGRDRRVEARGDAGEAAPRLDRAELDANTMADRSLQAELFQIYFDQAPTYFGYMRRGLEERDDDLWSAGCHGIKGTARTLGLKALAATAAEVQKKAPSEERYRAVEKRMDEAKAAAHIYLSEF